MFTFDRNGYHYLLHEQQKMNLGVFCAVAMVFLHFCDNVSLVEKIRARRQEVSRHCSRYAMRVLFGIPNCGEPV